MVYIATVAARRCATGHWKIWRVCHQVSELLDLANGIAVATTGYGAIATVGDGTFGFQVRGRMVGRTGARPVFT